MGEQVVASVDAVEDVGAVLDGGVVVVDLLDVRVVQGVGGLVWGQEVLCGEGIAAVLLWWDGGVAVRKGVYFKVLKIDHGKCSFYILSLVTTDTKMGYPFLTYGSNFAAFLYRAKKRGNG